MNADPQLSFATTEDILDELGRRNRTAIVITVTDDRNPDTTGGFYGYRGSPFEVVGVMGVYKKMVEDAILYPPESAD
jgi:hypothetical protein